MCIITTRTKACTPTRSKTLFDNGWRLVLGKPAMKVVKVYCASALEKSVGSVSVKTAIFYDCEPYS